MVAKSWAGPNPILAYISGSKAGVGALLDDLRTLIPHDHPKGPSAAEVFGYLPVGCEAYAHADKKAALPSGCHFYCPRETLQLVASWRAGTLPG